MAQVKNIQNSTGNNSFDNKVRELYLDTGGSRTYNEFHSGKNFSNTSNPWKNSGVTDPGAETDMNVLMNTGVPFFQSPWQNFDRWYTPFPGIDEVQTTQYIFFVRPELNLVEPATTGAKKSGSNDLFQLSTDGRVDKDPFFIYLLQNHQIILRSLTAEYGKEKTTTKAASKSGFGQAGYTSGVTDLNGNPLSQHSFIPFLVGRTESLQIPDYEIKTFGLVQPYSKFTMPYGTTTSESQTGGTMDVVFRDDSQLRIRKFFFAWIYYIDGIMRNKFKPKDKYILYNAFDYMTSIYHFVCDITGRNILYFSKYTGCMPTSVPTSDFSWNKGSSVENKVTISFSYFYHESWNPEIFTDFNYNSLGYDYMRNYVEKGLAKLPSIPSFNTDLGIMGQSLVGRPYVTTGRNVDSPKLNWMPASGSDQVILW